jgi:predicted aspartyl protease
MLIVVPMGVAGACASCEWGELFSTAGGSAELDEYVGVVEVMGMEAYVHLLVSSDVEVVLIGLRALKMLGLKVDPVTGKLLEGKVYLF